MVLNLRSSHREVAPPGLGLDVGDCGFGSLGKPHLGKLEHLLGEMLGSSLSSFSPYQHLLA